MSATSWSAASPASSRAPTSSPPASTSFPPCAPGTSADSTGARAARRRTRRPSGARPRRSDDPRRSRCSNSRSPKGELKIVPEPAGTRGGYDDLRRAASREPIGQGLRPSVASLGDLARMLAALDREHDRPALAQLRRSRELERGLSIATASDSPPALANQRVQQLLTAIASETQMHPSMLSAFVPDNHGGITRDSSSFDCLQHLGASVSRLLSRLVGGWSRRRVRYRSCAVLRRISHNRRRTDTRRCGFTRLRGCP